MRRIESDNARRKHPRATWLKLVSFSLAALSASAAAAQTSNAPCPAPGTILKFSDGGVAEAISDLGSGLCRYTSLRTGKTYERMFGAFVPTAPLFKENVDKLRSLIPLEVGKKMSVQYSGSDDNGIPGTWAITVSVEKYEKAEVLAGRFDAFVILREWQVMGQGGLAQDRWWYAPQVGYAVKYEHTFVRGIPARNYPHPWQMISIEKK